MKLKKSLSIRNVFTWIIVIFLFACKQNTTVPDQFKSVDSTWKKIEHALEVDTIRYRAIRTRLWELRNRSTQELEWITLRMQAHPDWLINNHLKSAVSLMRAWHFVEIGQDSLALIEYNNVRTEQIDLQLSAIQGKANYYYFNNNLDSAKPLFQKSYQIAKAQDNHSWLLRSANNIGTLYFDLTEYRTASNYFSEALKSAQALNLEVPMLINNVITCALVDAKTEEAISLYKKYNPIFKPSNDYERTIYNLNKIHLFWKTNQIDSFKYHLDRLPIENMGDIVESKRDQQYLFYYAYKKDYSSFAVLFEKYRPKLLNSPNAFFLQWDGLLSYAQNQGMPILTHAELIRLYNDPEVSKNNRLQSQISYLLYSNRKGTAEGDKWKIAQLNADLKIRNAESQNFQTNLRDQIKINELYNENKEVNSKLELESTEKAVYAITLIGTFGILILGGIAFVYFQKNRKIAIQKLQLELQNNRNLSELNQSKKQFAERLISTNQVFNKKLDKIASKLKQSNFGKDPEIIQIRRELESITEIKGDWSHELDQIKAIDGIHYLLDYFQCVQHFNQTEQTLLSYFINGHKVKEIATLMNLSEQHVRNTKTKVLKALSQEHQEEITIEQLISFREKGPI